MGKYDKPKPSLLPKEDESDEYKYSPGSKMGSEVMAIRADLKRLTEELMAAGGEYAEARKDAAQKSFKAKMDYVRLYAATDPDNKVDDRKGEATLKNESAQEAAELAEAKVDALKVVIKTLSDALNSTQTQARLVRDELKVAGVDAEF